MAGIPDHWEAAPGSLTSYTWVCACLKLLPLVWLNTASQTRPQTPSLEPQSQFVQPAGIHSQLPETLILILPWLPSHWTAERALSGKSEVHYLSPGEQEWYSCASVIECCCRQLMTDCSLKKWSDSHELPESDLCSRKSHPKQIRVEVWWLTLVDHQHRLHQGIMQLMSEAWIVSAQQWTAVNVCHRHCDHRASHSGERVEGHLMWVRLCFISQPQNISGSESLETIRFLVIQSSDMLDTMNLWCTVNIHTCLIYITTNPQAVTGFQKIFV